MITPIFGFVIEFRLDKNIGSVILLLESSNTNGIIRLFHEDINAVIAAITIVLYIPFKYIW